jgi:ABC-type antimicrobial peptide transport system permease subunit
LVRLFILESTVLGLAAGALGLLLAAWMISAAPKLAGANIPLEPTSPLIGRSLFLRLRFR